MFEALMAAPHLPQLQCTSPAFSAFAAAASSGALGYMMKQLCSPQPHDGDLCNFYRSFFNHNEELK